jgi:peptidoglycan hydrolase CwlO-like protein
MGKRPVLAIVSVLSVALAAIGLSIRSGIAEDDEKTLSITKPTRIWQLKMISKQDEILSNQKKIFKDLDSIKKDIEELKTRPRR